MKKLIVSLAIVALLFTAGGAEAERDYGKMVSNLATEAFETGAIVGFYLGLKECSVESEFSKLSKDQRIPYIIKKVREFRRQTSEEEDTE